MSKLLDALFQSAGSGAPALKAKIEQLGAALTPSVADEARESYKGAMTHQQLHLAFSGAIVASFLYLKFGQKKPSLEAHLDWHQILLVEATTVESHRVVHEGARDIVLASREIQERDLMFHARVLAADAAYFASKAAGEDKAQKEKWLATALEDLLAVFAERSDVADAGIWSQRLIGCLTATVEEIENSGLGKRPEILAALWQLAILVNVPVDFTIPGDPEKTERIARVPRQSLVSVGKRLDRLERISSRGWRNGVASKPRRSSRARHLTFHALQTRGRLNLFEHGGKIRK